MFSIPKQGAHFASGDRKPLDHCYLVSLKLEASK
jgi:hypothetical protein